MKYDEMSVEEIARDFIRIRGDWDEPAGNGSILMLEVLRPRLVAPILEPILELHRAVDDLGIGIKRCAQSCRHPVTGAIYRHPCPTYKAAKAE